MAPIVFSGIQPTGQITLGNYLGALKHFVKAQHDAQSYYCIVDLHAITVPQDPKELKTRILDLAALYLAVGLDPQIATLFVQSDVKEHAELGWLLQCNVHMGELSRMTQYKEKAEGKDAVSVGLFTYPALMAADILLYQTNLVPVGEDQKQHIEITRDIALRFNARFGDTFTIPEGMITKEGARIMSLDDPTKKMSKSNPNPASRIELSDTPDEIRKKFSRAVTDSGREVTFDPENKAAVANLLTIYATITDRSIESIVNEYEGRGYGDFKKGLGEAVIAHLEPIQSRLQSLRQSGDVVDILQEGAHRARESAQKTIDLVKRNIGLGTYY